MITLRKSIIHSVEIESQSGFSALTQCECFIWVDLHYYTKERRNTKTILLEGDAIFFYRQV